MLDSRVMELSEYGRAHLMVREAWENANAPHPLPFRRSWSESSMVFTFKFGSRQEDVRDSDVRKVSGAPACGPSVA